MAETLANLADGFVVFDREWRYTYVNAAAARLLNKTTGELLDQIVWDVFPEAARMAVYEHFHRAVEENVAIQFEQYAPGKGWYENRCQPTGEGLAVYFSDITERKHAEQEARRLSQELAQLNAELGQKLQERTAKLQEMVGELQRFSYAIMHDLRAPLRAMQGYGDILLKECGDRLQDRHKELLRRMDTATNRMDALITDGLQYSKAVQGEYGLTPVDAAKLLRGMVQSYPQLQPPLARLTIQEEMPLVLGNEAGLTQCFSNLLHNAVKFVPPDRVPTIRVWAERVLPAEPAEGSTTSALVRLWFEDNGIGIAREHQEQIWNMFERLHNGYEGAGIGLALVRKLVERMKGKVGVQSEPGRGSRFWIELQGAET